MNVLMQTTSYSSSDLNILDRFKKKYSNTKIHENPSSGSRVLIRKKDNRTDRRTYMTKQTVALRNLLQPSTVRFHHVWSYVLHVGSSDNTKDAPPIGNFISRSSKVHRLYITSDSALVFLYRLGETMYLIHEVEENLYVV
jgi:hypothetical protein